MEPLIVRNNETHLEGQGLPGCDVIVKHHNDANVFLAVTFADIDVILCVRLTIVIKYLSVENVIVLLCQL